MLNLIRMEVETGLSNLQDICVTTNKYISVQLPLPGEEKEQESHDSYQKRENN